MQKSKGQKAIPDFSFFFILHFDFVLLGSRHGPTLESRARERGGSAWKIVARSSLEVSLPNGDGGLRRTRRGHSGTERRTNPHLVARTERPLVAGERLSRRHAATDRSLGLDRHEPGRRAVADEHLRGRQDRLDAGGRHYVGHPGLRPVQGSLTAGIGQRVHDSRKQRYAVDRHGGRLHDLAADLQPGGLHDGHRPRDPHVAAHVVGDRAGHSRRAVRLSVQAAVYQR